MFIKYSDLNSLYHKFTKQGSDDKNSFHAPVIFGYPLKTIPLVFRYFGGYRKRPVAKRFKLKI